MRTQSDNKQAAGSVGKRAGKREWPSRKFSVLNLIGWEDLANFLEQSQSKFKKTKAILDYVRHSIENCSERDYCK